MNPKLLQQFKEEKLSVIPFILGLDIDNGNILLITHNEKKEVEDKIIHLECKISTKGISYLKKMSDILKKMV